jgi:hypothetical protein
MIWRCGPRAIAGHARDRYVYALLDGVLRDLTHDDVPVTVGTKVIEVDPRGRVGEVGGIAERPRRIAEAVLSAIRECEHQRR